MSKIVIEYSHAFSHLVSSLFLRPKTLMALFSAYFDASKNRDLNAMVVGCYIATVDQWQHFDREWREMLHDEQIPMMHWTDLEWGYGDFKGWERDRKIKVQKRALGIIKRRVSIGFGGGVIIPDYEATFTDSYKKAFGSHYSFCVHIIFRQIEDWVKKHGYTEDMAYVFECGDQGLSELVKLIQAYKKPALRPNVIDRCLIGSVSVIDKRKALPLQAADINAYETMKYMDNHVVSDSGRNPRKSALELIKVTHVGGYYDAESMKKYMLKLPLQ